MARRVCAIRARASGHSTGQETCRIQLPGSSGYASFVLMPLLNLLTNRRMVFVGGPGRGKKRPDGSFQRAPWMTTGTTGSFARAAALNAPR